MEKHEMMAGAGFIQRSLTQSHTTLRSYSSDSMLENIHM